MKLWNFQGAIHQVKNVFKGLPLMLSVCITQKEERKGRPPTHAMLDQKRNMHRNPEVHTFWFGSCNGPHETYRQSNKRTSLRVPEPQLTLDDFHHRIRSLLSAKYSRQIIHFIMSTQSVGWEVALSGSGLGHYSDWRWQLCCRLNLSAPKWMWAYCLFSGLSFFFFSNYT